MKTTTTVTDIQPKPHTFHGVVRNTRHTDGIYNADIIKGDSIRLYGTYANRISGGIQFDKTFRVGDWCEYDSYNLAYTGKITAISDKSVTVQPDGRRNARRLDLYTFAWRNWDFDLDAIAKRNADFLD